MNRLVMDKGAKIGICAVVVIFIAAMLATWKYIKTTKFKVSLREITPSSQNLSFCSPMWYDKEHTIFVISRRDTNYDGKCDERDHGVLVRMGSADNKMTELTDKSLDVTKLVGIWNDHIYFLGKTDIWSIAVEKNSNPYTVVSESENISAASISPDGKHIAYTSNDELWVVGIDGKTGRKNLTESLDPCYRGYKPYGKPIWSPDSMHILCALYDPVLRPEFEQFPCSSEMELQMKGLPGFPLPPMRTMEIWQFSICGGDYKQITNEKENSEGYAHSPAWKGCGAGKKIAYVVTKRDQQRGCWWQDIYIKEIDEETSTNLTENMDRCFTPVWGTKNRSNEIVFVAVSNFGTNLWLLDTDIEDIDRKPKDHLTLDLRIVEAPVWVPDPEEGKLLITVREKGTQTVKLVILEPKK